MWATSTSAAFSPYQTLPSWSWSKNKAKTSLFPFFRFLANFHHPNCYKIKNKTKQVSCQTWHKLCLPTLQLSALATCKDAHAESSSPCGCAKEFAQLFQHWLPSKACHGQKGPCCSCGTNTARLMQLMCPLYSPHSHKQKALDNHTVQSGVKKSYPFVLHPSRAPGDLNMGCVRLLLEEWCPCAQKGRWGGRGTYSKLPCSALQQWACHIHEVGFFLLSLVPT